VALPVCPGRLWWLVRVGYAYVALCLPVHACGMQEQTGLCFLWFSLRTGELYVSLAPQRHHLLI